ncbi:MAG: hypothetical protein JWR73_1929 [Tardiphaga sp.]|jgi:hypothetical protein|nr:hypothetical protein [Tardiphaga sp.]MDB5626127.1 hypothetical protein [Tardiphaga sp.]
MNHTLHTADRSTHLRIISVALVAAILLTAFGIYARWDLDVGHQAAGVLSALPAASLPSASLPMAVVLTPDRMW